MLSIRRPAGGRRTAYARAAAPGRRSASTRSGSCAPGATGCFRSRGKIRGCVCSKRATPAEYRTARLGSDGVLVGGAALLAGAPDAAGAALVAATALGLGRLLLPAAVPHNSAAHTLPSIRASAADHSVTKSLHIACFVRPRYAGSPTGAPTQQSVTLQTPQSDKP